MNGVISIITRSARETRGGYLELGGGNEERGFGGFQYGGRVGDNAHLRGYVKHFERDSSAFPDGGEGQDAWRMTRVGFRADWEVEDSDVWTFQGDLYRGEEGGLFPDAFTLGTLPGPSYPDEARVSGGNVMARWARRWKDGAELRVQAYYDRTSREIPGTYDEKRDTLDLDFQHRFQLGARHELLWGAGFRITSDDLKDTLFATFEPDRRRDLTFSPLVQDRIDLWNDRLFLTLGSKLEHNDYTGFEIQPNARLSYLMSSRQTAWAALSRAVRIPSRLDADLRLTAPLSLREIPVPVYAIVNGSDDFASEELIAYEAGYRVQVRDHLSFDAAAFYNDYDRLQTFEPALPVVLPDTMVPYILLPNYADNGMEGESYGATLAGTWQPLEWCRWQLQYAFLELDLRRKEGSLDSSSESIEGNSPSSQFSSLWFADLPGRFSLYAGLRFVGEIPNQEAARYTELDANLIWSGPSDLEIAFGVQNLLEDRRLEFGGNAVERSLLGKVTWRF